MRISVPAVCTAALLAAPVMAQNAAPGPANPPVAGIIQSFDGKVLTITTADGSAVAAALAPNVRLTATVKKTLADIKPGARASMMIGKAPDGSATAMRVTVSQ